MCYICYQQVVLVEELRDSTFMRDYFTKVVDRYKVEVEQLFEIQGLAKHTEKHVEWKLPCAPEPEHQAAGSYCVAQGALQGKFWDLGGGHGVRAGENVRGNLKGEGPALEQGQAWDGGEAKGQLLLGSVFNER